MSKISVVVNTYNEEKNIKRCLDSVEGFADEIVVVDMHSEDKTRKIAKKAGAKVFEYKKMGYVEPARNFAISKAKYEWVLIMDADEELSNELKKKIKKIMKEPKADYYRLPRKNIVFGKWMEHSRWWPDYNIRFFRKGSVSWSEIIHSVPVTVGEGADLPADENLAIIHHNYQTVGQYIERMNRYSEKQAEVLIGKDYEFSWRDLIRKPTGEFLSRYFAGRGYMDGVHGLALASLQALSELVVYLKVWEHEKFEEKKVELDEINKEFNNFQKDINYWKADAMLNEGGGFIPRLKRKFKLQ